MAKNSPGERVVHLSPTSHQHIPPFHLPNLHKYKYSGTDRSILSRYVMQYYWNFVVNLLPMGLAPNVITLIGFIVGLSSSFIILFYYLLADAVFPSWVWYYAAGTLFFYQTMDAIDGKQARRTQSGSPMGELFDHGCDALLMPFVMMNLTLALNFSSDLTFFFFIFSSAMLFLTIWEQFCTGSLDLGIVNGPVEGILISVMMFLISGYYGRELWSTPLIKKPVTLPLVQWDGESIPILQINHAVAIIAGVIGLGTMCANLWHVFTRPHVHHWTTSFLSLAAPSLLAAIVWCVYVAYPSLIIDYPFLLEMAFSFNISYTLTRMTVARLCNTPFHFFNISLILAILILGGALASHWWDPNWASNHIEPLLGYTAGGLAAFALLKYAHTLISVFNQIGTFLNLQVFSLSPKSKIE